MLLLGKTQKEHPGHLPSTVPDLPLHPRMKHNQWFKTLQQSYTHSFLVYMERHKMYQLPCEHLKNQVAAHTWVKKTY